MSSFAQQLTLLRESRGLKKKELAEILNVSAPCISQYEKGVTMPSHDTLSRIAQYFGVSVDFLIASENDSNIFLPGDTFYGKTTYLDLLKACGKIPSRNRKALLTIIGALQEYKDG